MAKKKEEIETKETVVAEKPAIVKKRWRAICPSWGFMGRHWEKDQEVILDPGVKPNKHFELMGDYIPPENGEQIPEEQKALSQMPIGGTMPTGGMGASLPEGMKAAYGKTAAQELKDKK